MLFLIQINHMLLKHGQGLHIRRPCDSVDILPNSYENTVSRIQKASLHIFH